jgi:hypothetical protein
MVFGTCVHHLIAEDLAVGEPRLDLLSNMNEWVEKILVEDYAWSLAQVPEPQRFFSEVSAAYRQWRTGVYPNLPEPIALEKEMYLKLGDGVNGGYYLRGTPDAVFGNQIMDWKTAGRAWKEGKADYSIQASLYMALAKQELDVGIRKFSFWVFDRAKRVWSRIPTDRTVKEINSALQTAYDYAYKLEVRAFTASPVVEEYGKKKRGWYCGVKYCPAWNICPVKYLDDNTDEKAIAVRSW